MAGMLGAGSGYQHNALSGFARVSAEEQQREQANKQMDQQKKNSEISTGISAAALIASIVMAF